MFLTGTGGLLDDKGEVIDSINLATEYEHLAAQPWINGGMRVKIEQIKALLDKLPPSSSVSITKPAELAKELFTHKGSGTLVRRGEKVVKYTAWDELDRERLRGLIESSFGRTYPRFYIRGLGNTDFDVNAAQPVSVVYDDVAMESPMLKAFPVFDS